MRKTNIALLVCLGISLLAPNIEAGGDTPQDQPANPPAARPASRDSQKRLPGNLRWADWRPSGR